MQVGGDPDGRIGAFALSDPEQVLKTQNNLFEVPAVAAQAATTVQQGYPEGSNVDPLRAMADLMMAGRVYGASARRVVDPG